MKRIKAIILVLCKASPLIVSVIAMLVNNGLSGTVSFRTFYWTLTAVGWIVFIGHSLNEVWNAPIYDDDDDEYYENNTMDTMNETDTRLSTDFYEKKNFAYKEYGYYSYRINTSYNENEIEECKKIRDLYLREYQAYVALETEALDYYMHTYPDKFNEIEQVKL